ncbi:hypothetical protein QNH14_09125 [Apirhabdus apintestini]|nr:hypothetical protein QNH14_09125 [Enterobacteriaceae bacterium CA-0114]
MVTEGPLFIANLKPRPVNVVINRFGFALLFWDLNLIRLAETFLRNLVCPSGASKQCAFYEGGFLLLI